MKSPADSQTIDEIAEAPTWDSRVELIRKVPEKFGIAQHARIYAAIARRIYVPSLAPDFAYVHWRDDYEREAVEKAYEIAADCTSDFKRVDVESIAATIEKAPTTLRIFRLLLGFTPSEFAASTAIVAERLNLKPVKQSRIKAIEAGAPSDQKAAQVCAQVVDDAMARTLFPRPPANLKNKIEKTDTQFGWASVQKFAMEGVPLALFLHQRHYGGAFRQLLDATSSARGDLIEDAVGALFESTGIQYLRTGSHNQAEIKDRFGITVRPTPDFVVFKGKVLQGLLECKGANDGGTARDKASRFRALRAEATRLGGVPLFAVLAGLGWRRELDALGPVIRDTDGRVFTIPTLPDMLTVQPFPQLMVRKRGKK